MRSVAPRAQSVSDALEEGLALGVIMNANGDTIMANACADMVEAIGAFLDFRDARGDWATAGSVTVF
ncbi:hypothetical protein MFUR16E_18620 [Methylobacterium fujisawaense]|uniref:hypothetical protein n=1 Tax=Methylobacterium fujisawaense TaxID=107400 RepID=UPI002F30FC41